MALQEIYEHIDDRRRPGVSRVRNTREMVVHSNYLVVHRIIVLDLQHARRRYLE